jgi:hypothetical protein
LITFAIGLCIILALYFLKRPALDVPMIFVGVSQSSTRNAKDPLPPPPNPFAYEDARLMSDWFDKGTDQHVVFVGSVSEQTGPMAGVTSGKSTLLHSILSNLGNAKPGGPGGDMVTVFLTAVGIVDHGHPYLLVGDSQVDDASTWVSVASLLQGIKDFLESDQWEFPEARVVVFLDAGRGGEAWDWGKTDLSFTKTVQQVASKIAPQRIAVLASCKEGQRSWCDPRRARSLFAEAIVESFIGNGDTDGDGTITLGEIESYVATQVATDAKAIWSADQKPVLLDQSNKDWEIIDTPSAVAGPPAMTADIDDLASNLSMLDQLWQRHNDLDQRHHPPLITQPVAWAVLEKKLARLEWLAVSGSDYRGELKILAGECEALLAELGSGASAIPDVSSLPELELVRFFHGSGTRTEKQLELNQVLHRGTPLENVDIQPEIDEIQMIDLVWDWLHEEDFSPQRIQTAGVLLDKVTSQRGIEGRLLETELIRLVSSPDLPLIHAERCQPILQSHIASRQSLLLPDLRASFWIRKHLLAMDERRMVLTDTAFARGETGGAEARLRRMIDQDYAELRREGEFISNAYQLRDRMLHRIPRLSETLFSDGPAHGNRSDHENTASLISNATRAVRCLSSQLRLVDVNPGGEVDDLRSAYQTAQESMSRLQARMIDRVDNASLRAASDEKGLRKTLALLRGSGFTEAESRKRIHDRLIEILRSDSRSQKTLAPTKGNSDPSEVETAHYIDGQHPWLYWLRQTESYSCKIPANSIDRGDDTDATLDVEFQADQVRAAISTLVTDDKSEVRLRPEKLAGEGQPLAVVRQPVEDLDLEYRRQTMLLSHRAQRVQRATEDRFALDLQLFLLDHGLRTIREFWCEARKAEQPYFTRAARQLLSCKAFRPLDPILDSVNVQQKYELAASTATDRETLVAQPDDRFSDGALLDNIGDDPISFVIKRPSILPEGEVALWSSKESKLLSLGDSSTESITTPLRIPADFKAVDDGFAVNSFFRGMRRKGKLEIKKLSDPRVTLYRRSDYGPPTAIVESDVQGAENVVIVLDCSGSMKNGKLEQARRAVVGYLASLKRNKCSIGLVLFGHRYGWVQDGQFLVRDTSAAGKKYKVYTMRAHQEVRLKSLGLTESSGHHPDTDVEVAVDLDAPTDQQIAMLKDALQDADPVGITPTYHAIVKAYDVLGGKPGHIVVLTDGKPELTGSNVSRYRAEAMQRYQTSKNVRLSIVDFQNKEDQANLRKDFVGATIVDADSTGELAEQLENTIASTKVVWKRNAENASDEVGLDQIVPIETWPPLDSEIAEGLPQSPALPYSVEAIRQANSNRATASVRVEGGEAFRLQVSGRSLRHLPFPREDYLYKELRVEGPDSSKFTALAIQPDRNENRELRLRLVIEAKRQGDFTPRPVDAWVDVKGTNSDRTKSIEYSISLPSFESGRSVPVLLARVKDWPNWAVRVNLDASLRFEEIRADGVSLPLASKGPFTVPAIEGVSFTVEQEKRGTHEVTITETYRSDALIGKLRVLLDPLPRDGEVRVHRKERIVIRKFRYAEPQDRLTASVTRREQITDGASLRIRTRDSITVDDGK